MATDTFYANGAAHDGSTCDQIFVGQNYYFTQVYGMSTDAQFPGRLMDFICSFGAMSGLFTDNDKEEQYRSVQAILRQYMISDMSSEPHYQNQNYAERRIQDVKKMTNVTMDWTGTPGYLWLLCIMYCCYILNRLAHRQLANITPIQKAYGITPDISVLLCFIW